ncbi:MAG: RIO1 family regulatory kinase/ATPase [Polyangiaceae bacterium]
MSHDDATIEDAVETFLSRGLITEVLGELKSGKEATVLACRAGPDAGCERAALKVYRPRTARSFRNDAVYQEGRFFREDRATRAFRNKSRFGREVQQGAWIAREWEVARRLHAAGVAVPRPIDAAGGSILMDLFEDEDGVAAPPLQRARLAPDEARSVLAALLAEVERMLAAHVVHGDLSPYNVLWARGALRIIDFPQAVDPRQSDVASLLLARDVDHIFAFCARSGVAGDPARIAAELWARYEAGVIG